MTLRRARKLALALPIAATATLAPPLPIFSKIANHPARP